MTSITGSPSPKPRAGRNNHRQTKSGSFISTSSQFNPKHHTQQPNLHFHNNHQLPPNLVPNNRGSARTSAVMTPPRTPKAQQFANTNADASGKKKKNKKQQDKKQEKPRPKDVITTKVLKIFPSDPVPVEVESPPLSGELPGGQITPSKLSSTPPAKAYAGPTFHSSPAPSALPMPKFFSKSVPATPAGTSLQTMMESDASDSSDSTAGPTGREQSQLELLFRAARAENMGMKRQGSGSTSSSEAMPDPFSGTFGYVGNAISLFERCLRLTRMNHQNQSGPRVAYPQQS